MLCYVSYDTICDFRLKPRERVEYNAFLYSTVQEDINPALNPSPSK